MLPEPFREMDLDDEVGWQAVADWLEEHDAPQRAELVRLTRLLRHGPRVPDAERHQDRLRELLAAGVEPCFATRTNSIGMEFVYIPAGVCLMGAPLEEEGCDEDERPMHEVEITRGFYLGRYPVTQAEYESVMGSNPSRFASHGDDDDSVEGMDTRRFPVEQVTYDDALSFLEKLAQKEQRDDRSYRLPTEAEWEFACRGGAGSETPFHHGSTLSPILANFDGNYPYPYPYGTIVEGVNLRRTCEVGSYLSNGFGLFDLSGNVWEWCNDWYAYEYYVSSTRPRHPPSFADRYILDYDRSPVQDPTGPAEGSVRVVRGGSWRSAGAECRSAHRNKLAPMHQYDSVGFRVALVPCEQRRDSKAGIVS